MTAADTRGGGVCVVGSLNIDTFFRVPVLPGPGETILATDRSFSPGGKGANQSVAAATLGSRVRFVGAVGTDENGDQGLAALESRGVDTSAVRRLEDTPTGTATILVDDEGENIVIVDPAANSELDPDWVTSALAEGSDEVVLAQLEIPLETLLAAARTRPRLFVLNPAPVADPVVLRPLLELVDVLVPNRAELGLLAGGGVPSTLDEVAGCAKRLGFRGTLVVTLGSDGAAIFDADGELVQHVPAPAVDAVDTTGAGDAFCGVLAHELAKPGAELAAAVRRAVDLAAGSTLHAGAQVPHSFGREDVEV
jgi:ribokinase